MNVKKKTQELKLTLVFPCIGLEMQIVDSEQLVKKVTKEKLTKEQKRTARLEYYRQYRLKNKSKIAKYHTKRCLEKRDYIKNNPNLFPKALCLCECGQETKINIQTGKPYKFIKWHYGCTQPKGENSSRYKIDDVGYKLLHERMAKLIPKPDKCPKCNRRNVRLVLSNTGHTYNPDNLEDWEWLCDSCHLIKDGRVITDFSNRFCSICSSKETRMEKQKIIGLRPVWLNLVKGVKNGLYKCSKCACKQIYYSKKVN